MRENVVGLDPARLADLRVFTDDELREIFAGVARRIGELLATLGATMISADLGSLADAAHQGRNEAVCVGAVELGKAFEVLETAARSAELAPAKQAVERLNVLWPSTRAAIERIALHGSP